MKKQNESIMIPFEVKVENEDRTIYSMIDKTQIFHYDWTKPLTQYDDKFEFEWINGRPKWGFYALVRSDSKTIDWWYRMKKIVATVRRIN